MRTRAIVRGSALFAALAVISCAANNGRDNRPLRSPTLDYPPPAAQTSDGRIVGVDEVPPDEYLDRSVKAGNRGLQPASGWSFEHGILEYRRESAGHVSVEEREGEAEPPPQP